MPQVLRDNVKLLINGSCDLAGRHYIQTTANHVATSTANAKTANAAWLLDGSGKMWTPDSTDWDFGTGDFTVEGWYRSVGSFKTPTHLFEFGNSQTGSAGNGLLCQYRGSGYEFNLSASTINRTYGCVLPTNAWFHFAITRQGDSVWMYINGESIGESTGWSGHNFTAGNQGFSIGGDNYSGTLTFAFPGYVDGFRVSNSARYPSGTTFTPYSTMPAVDANTKLLITGGVEQIDSPYGMMSNSDTAIFAENTVEPVGVGSLFGTGTAGDFFLLNDNAALDLGNGNFTIGCYHYSSYVLDSAFFGHNEDANNRWGFYWTSADSKLRFKAISGGVTVADYECSHTRSSAWHYFTAERDGSTFRMYIDGVAQTLTVNTAIGTNTMPTSSNRFMIGGAWDGNNSIAGHLCLCSIFDSAYWGGDFTPPTDDWELIDEPPSIAVRQTLKQFYRMANDSLERYELYIGEGSEPDLTASPAATSATLPFTAAVTPPGAGTTELHCLVCKRNKFNLLSFNRYSDLIEIDTAGDEVLGPLTAPTAVAIIPGANGYFTVTARYVATDRNQANAWVVEIDSAEEYAGAMRFSFGVGAYLQVEVGPFDPGEVSVVVSSKRTEDGALAAADAVAYTVPTPPAITAGNIFLGMAAIAGDKLEGSDEGVLLDLDGEDATLITEDSSDLILEG